MNIIQLVIVYSVIMVNFGLAMVMQMNLNDKIDVIRKELVRQDTEFKAHVTQYHTGGKKE